jgi:hypothetical protein
MRRSATALLVIVLGGCAVPRVLLPYPAASQERPDRRDEIWDRSVATFFFMRRNNVRAQKDAHFATDGEMAVWTDIDGKVYCTINHVVSTDAIIDGEDLLVPKNDYRILQLYEAEEAGFCSEVLGHKVPLPPHPGVRPR